MFFEMRWYALRAVSGQEKKVKEILEGEIRRSGWEKKIGQVLVPMEKYIEIKDGKKKLRERNYMQGYIFVQAHLDAELILKIKDIPGCIGFLGAEKGGMPNHLQTQEIERMLGKTTSITEDTPTVDVLYREGQRVKIIDGTLLGFSAQITKVDDAKKKLTLEVKIFGRNQSIEIGYDQVEPETEVTE